MPYLHSPSQKGNLYIKFNVTIPQANMLDEETMKIIQSKLAEKRRITTASGKEILMTESAIPPNFDAMRREEDRRDEELKYKKRKHKDDEGMVNCSQQ
jgi:transposase